ncbi:MAG: radical SAM protein [Solobacterium sp.]|nr:radical SAM protein [Solobacterium sp.]
MKNTDIQKIENPGFKENVFDIRWRVTTFCNYQCDFCIQGTREEHLRQAQGESRQIRSRICDEIIKLVESLKGYHTVNINLIGGELTILPDFPQILDKLASCRFPGKIRFYITTNFSQDAGYFCRLCGIIQKKPVWKRRRLFIAASFYSAYTDIQTFSGKLMEVYSYANPFRHRHGKLSELCRRLRNTVDLSAGIPILNDEDYAVFTEMRETFKNTGVSINPILIRNYETNVLPETTKKLLDSADKRIKVTTGNGQEFMYQNIQALGAALEGTDSFCPRGYLCDAGIHSIWIDAFGHVNRCPAIGSRMHLGNILNEGFHLLDSPEICTSDHCSCSQYGKIEKPSDMPCKE